MVYGNWCYNVSMFLSFIAFDCRMSVSFHASLPLSWLQVKFRNSVIKVNHLTRRSFHRIPLKHVIALNE